MNQGSVITQQTEEGREGNSFLYEDYEEGPNLDRLPAQCACAGDGGGCGLRMRGTPDVYTASRQQSRSRHTGHLAHQWPLAAHRAVDRGEIMEEVQGRLSVMQ